MNVWMNEGVIEWMDEWIEWMNPWMNEWMNEWMDEWMNEWMNEWSRILATTFPDRGAQPRKQRPSLGDHGRQLPLKSTGFRLFKPEFTRSRSRTLRNYLVMMWLPWWWAICVLHCTTINRHLAPVLEHANQYWIAWDTNLSAEVRYHVFIIDMPLFVAMHGDATSAGMTWHFGGHPHLQHSWLRGALSESGRHHWFVIPNCILFYYILLYCILFYLILLYFILNQDLLNYIELNWIILNYI